MSDLTFTRRAAGWYRARGAHHRYSVSMDLDTRLWRLTIWHEDTSQVSTDVWATMTFAKQKAAEFERAQHRACDCMTEDLHDGLGERVVEHSLRCRLHPEYAGELS